MLKGIFKKIIGDSNQKELDRLQPIVDEIVLLEDDFERMSDEALRGLTDEFKQHLHLETAGLRSRLERLRRELSFQVEAGRRGRLGAEIQRLQESLNDTQERTLREILPRAFAAVREVSKRTIGLRHFEEQLLGGIVIHQGKVAEMKTGEGKTLVATLPLYLNALTGRGVHLVTVNDYLARRDAAWMGPIYHTLGLSVAVLREGESKAALYVPGYSKGELADLRSMTRQEAYAADITYGTNHEFGFDYLRDNLVLDRSMAVQRELNYAIVDEVDNIFIDEARTPLIISGPSREPLEEYKRFAAAVTKLNPDADYEVDTKGRSVALTEQGIDRLERETGILDIYDEANYRYVHFMQQAINARALYRRDRDYIVRGRRVILIDHFTGRLMPDRKLSDGLHQAIEAKEGVPVTPRNVIHATITIQNCFRMYRKLAGMTGTAVSEAEEFDKIYGLEVVVVPTHEPMIREDLPDVVYKNERAKWNAIIDEIIECHRMGRPVLVGTTSVEKSEALAQRLAGKKIRYDVLNAKRHAEEAKIIARAGEPGRVTIATNMAGRGVDIKLGGELLQETIEEAHKVLGQRGVNPFEATPEQLESAVAEVMPEYAQRRELVVAAGGLHVLGTERHEARRIDNQLRGRAGRQGEPGSSRFFLSLEDDLMRRFGGSRIASLMDRVGLEEEIPIEHGLVDRAIESTQARVEGYNFDIRKHLLEYDDVLDTQRKAIYGMRQRILDGESVSADVHAMIEGELAEQVSRVEAEDASVWDLLSRLDGLTFAIPLRGSVYRGSIVLAGQLSCFPPLSLSLLAGGMSDLEPTRFRDDLLRRTGIALEHYLSYLLDDVMVRGFEQVTSGDAEQRREDRFREISDSLLNQVDAYLAQTGTQKGMPNYRSLLQQLQRSSYVPLRVGASDLRGLDIEDAKDVLLTALEQSYSQVVYENLVGWVHRRMPLALQLNRTQVSDLDQSVWEAFIAHARSRARTDQDLAQIERLDKAVGQPSQGNKGAGLLTQVAEVGQWAEIDFTELEHLLRHIVEARHGIWAEQVKKGVEEALERSLAQRAKGEVAGDVTQILVETFYAVQRVRSPSGQTAQRSAPRLPLHFLLAEDVEKMEPEDLQARIQEHLSLALNDRETTWAEQEMSLLARQRLSSLEPSSREALVQYLGTEQLRECENVSIGRLEERLREEVLLSLRMQVSDQVRLPELGGDEYQNVLAFLKEELAAGVANSPVAELDEQTRQVVETHLHERGYFDDRDLEAHYMQRRLGELSEDVRAGIAQYLGRRFVEMHPDTAFGELGTEERGAILRFFESRRHFVDEERVRRFFVSGCLNDLGEDIAARTAEYLAGEQLRTSRRRRLADLDERTRERVMEFLLQSERFLSEERAKRFPEIALRDLATATREDLLVRLGETRLRADAPVSQQPEEVRQQTFAYLRSTGFFRDKDREEVVLAQPLPELSPEIAEAVQRHALASLREELASQAMTDLPQRTKEEVHDYLREADYFVDPDLAERLLRQPLISLDVQTLHNLEEQLGADIMRPLADVPFRQLDRKVRDDILGFMDQDGLLRKKSRRKRFVQGSLGKASKEIFDTIAHHLGRSRLAPVRRMPLRDAPSELREQIWRYLRSTRYLLDEEKVGAFDDQRLENFGPVLAGQVEQRLSKQLRDQLSSRPIGELPERLQRYAMRHVVEAGLLLDEKKVSSFQELIPTHLEAGLRRGLSRELGRGLLGGESGVSFGQLDVSLRQQVRDVLEDMRYFTDEKALEDFMQMRVEELDGRTLEDLTKHLGHRLVRDIAPEPVAALDEGRRRQIRTYLDQVSAFVDDARVEEFQRDTFRALSRDDRDKVARSLGESQLAGCEQERLGELEASQRDAVYAYLRSRETFLDRSRLERFRASPISDLDADLREAVLARIQQEWEEELSERTLATLSPTLRSHIKDYLRSDSPVLPGTDAGGLEQGSVSELDPEQHAYLVRHLGEQEMKRIERTRVADLAERDRAALRGFLGWRTAEDAEKDVLLTTTSALWIDYLTAIEDLRQGIGLQAYAQRDPLVEYRRRAYEMYQELQANIQRTVVSRVFRHSPRRPRLLQAEVREGRTASDEQETGEAEAIPSEKKKVRERRKRSGKRRGAR